MVDSADNAVVGDEWIEDLFPVRVTNSGMLDLWKLTDFDIGEYMGLRAEQADIIRHVIDQWFPPRRLTWWGRLKGWLRW